MDIVSVRDVGLATTPDPLILEWAANNDRILITRDVSSMTNFAKTRVAAGIRMPGMLLVLERASARTILEIIENMALYGLEAEWEGRILFIGSTP